MVALLGCCFGVVTQQWVTLTLPIKGHVSSDLCPPAIRLGSEILLRYMSVYKIKSILNETADKIF